MFDQRAFLSAIHLHVITTVLYNINTNIVYRACACACTEYIYKRMYEKYD